MGRLKAKGSSPRGGSGAPAGVYGADTCWIDESITESPYTRVQRELVGFPCVTSIEPTYDRNDATTGRAVGLRATINARGKEYTLLVEWHARAKSTPAAGTYEAALLHYSARAGDRMVKMGAPRYTDTEVMEYASLDDIVSAVLHRLDLGDEPAIPHHKAYSHARNAWITVYLRTPRVGEYGYFVDANDFAKEAWNAVVSAYAGVPERVGWPVEAYNLDHLDEDGVDEDGDRLVTVEVEAPF